jgi:type 1 glutamine amidotransferase
MTKTLRLAAALALLVPVGMPLRAGDIKEQKKIRVLLIDGQNNHNWKATTPILKKALEDSERFIVEVATTPALLRAPTRPQEPRNANDEKAQAKYKEDLAKYKDTLAKYNEQLTAYKEGMTKFRPDLTKYDVVLSNYNGDLWSADFQKDLEEALKAGKIGLVIVHAANNAFRDWDEYNLMIGMGWRGNDAGDRLTLDSDGKEKRVPKGTGPGAGHGVGRAFLVTVRDGEHPITKGMPDEWMHAHDELYHGMRGPIRNVHLLATAYSDRSKGGTGEHEPMIWTVTYGKGRVFHTPMGHAEPALRCWGFIGTLQRGTEWAATGEVTLKLPTAFPTAEKTSSIPEN